jgi:hypothetical protein
MFHSARIRTRRFAGLIAGVSIAAAASADVTDVVLNIEAASAAGGSQASFALSGGSWNATTKTYSWTQATPVNLLSPGGAVVATLRSASVTLKKCSEISVNFSVDAGSSATEFVVRSPVLSFAAIASADAQAKATARLDIDDLNNDGATMTGAPARRAPAHSMLATTALTPTARNSPILSQSSPARLAAVVTGSRTTPRPAIAP